MPAGTRFLLRIMGTKGATVSDSFQHVLVLEEGQCATGCAMCHVTFPFDGKNRSLGPHSQGKQNSVGCLLEPRPLFAFLAIFTVPVLVRRLFLEAFLGDGKALGQG
jgi:hypothetical protein